MTRSSTPNRKDHPRIRGEHRVVDQLGDVRGGSSPHTRGALFKTKLLPRQPWDHPRIRGEHEIPVRPQARVDGSSPHTRGAPGGGVRAEACRGIIPAYAGSTRCSGTSTRRRSDHPRIRGEHGRRPPALRLLGGSSPHTRGAQTRRWCRYRVTGIIPAYAGSTAPFLPTEVETTDHPRIRGEHAVRSGRVGRLRASSPHTRGARSGRWVGEQIGGIIPAYAGSTHRSPPFHYAATDHPRIRGEHAARFPPVAQGLGSSPHTRGARPAPVHQHVPDGSSPHTRGARQIRASWASGRRIIPAYAGSTGRR